MTMCDTAAWAGTSLGPLKDWPGVLRTLSEVILGSHQPMFVAWGPEHRLFYNQKYAEILGGKHPRALGEPILEAWSEIRADLVPLIARTVAGGSVHMDDIALVIERNGYPEHTHFSFSHTPVRDGATGAVLGFFCVCTERTAQMLADRRLRDSEAQFRALAQAVPNHAWTAGPDGGLEWFNEPTYAYSGLDWESLAGAGWTQLVHPDDLQRAGAVWAHSLATGEVYTTEFRIRRADGAYRWHLVRAQPIRGEGGGIVQWIGTNTDVEKERRARDALAALNKELEERVAARTAERDRLWELSEDLLVIADYDGRLLRVSPSWTRLLGHDEGALLTLPYDTLLHPDDVPAVMDVLAEMRATGRPVSFEKRLRAADGSFRWLAWTLAPEPGGQRLSGVGRDMTGAKVRAAELEAAQEALRQSQKMEAVGQLTGGLAHDFNNLLAGITGSLELLQMRVAQGRTAEVGRYVTAAQGAARRAAALTHRLLAFSRRQTLDPRPVDANALVGGMEELVRRTAGPAITVEVEAGRELWTTLVDPNQLENALLNLCINARDAMPDGGRLVVSTGNAVLDGPAASALALGPGPYVRLSVADTGIGMSPEVLRRAFDPFFTTKPIGQGTGLGLSMIYGFVQQSGGQARIHSARGQGTEVCLYLPRHDGAAEARPEEAPAAAIVAGRGETVLVVDDEPTVRMLVAEVLEELGYATLEAADGVAGLEVLRSVAAIDMLVTDVGLPGGLNGRQMADAGRALRPGLPVLFITGYAEHAVLGEGQLEPGMHVLAKPFGLDELAARIREIIG